MMRRGSQIYALILIPLAALLSSCASGETGIKIEAAWARPAVQGANTAVYLQITNLDPDDAWISVESSEAEAAELHRSILQADGTARMERQDKIGLTQNETVELVPGGLHVMLFGLKQTLEPGDRINLSLVFNQHERVEINVPVKNP
ncbi:MAG: copper chaperone PCu(A)C [Anaerolineales bacterium]|nr:MAG: copper chaperone PCu(A)C [Anaerolineales bacterium]